MSVYFKRAKKQVNFTKPFKQYVAVTVPAGASNSLIDILSPSKKVLAKVITIQTQGNTTFSEFNADGNPLGGYVGPGGYKEFDFLFYYNDEILIEDVLKATFSNTGGANETVSFTVYGWEVE